MESLISTVYCLLFALFSLVLIAGCNSGISEKPSYDDAYLNDVVNLVSHTPLDHGRVVDIKGLLLHQNRLFSTEDFIDTGSSAIKAYRVSDNSLFWKWSDANDKYNRDGFVNGGHSPKQYFHDGLLITNESNLVWTIDIDLGTTVDEFVADQSLRVLYGNNNIAAFTYAESDSADVIGVIDIKSGVVEQIDRHRSSNPYWSGVNSPMTFADEQGNTLVAYVTVDWLPGTLEEHYWLNLYDIDRGEKVWKSDSIPVVLPGGNMGNRIRYSNGKLILANNMIYAYNVEDGTLAWSRDYGNSFILSSHPIVAEGRVYANNDSGFMVCLDVETGREIWRTDTGGSPSPIVHYDGRIYMSNVTQPGGNSLLVIDADTGDILYDVVAPYDPDVDPSPLFNDAIAVDPETGYVYVGNYRDLLVYDFP